MEFSVYPDMKSTGTSGRIDLMRSAISRPRTFPGRTTSVSSRSTLLACAPKTRSASCYGLLALGLLAAIALLPRLIGRIRSPFTWIEAGELKRRIDSGQALTIIDVRGTDEFIGPLGHIATARNIPVTDLDSRIGELAGLGRAPLVIACRTDKRSATAARTLRAAGFTQVGVLRRGMEQWNAAGLPVAGRAASAASAAVATSGRAS